MKRTVITAPETQRRKTALRAKLKELLGTGVAREELQIEHLADPIDQTTSDSNRELALYNADHKTRLIQDVKMALEAMEDGSYGVCERCEHPIPPKRLDAVPWTRMCVACQSAEEAAGEPYGRSGEVPVFSYAA